MKRAWVALILLSSAVGLARVGQAKGERTPNEFEQTLMTAEKGFIEAAKKGDRAFFKDTLTADFSYVSFRCQRRRRDKKDALRQDHFRSMLVDFGTDSAQEHSLGIIGPSLILTAFCCGSK